MRELLVVGAGRMGSALIEGLLSGGTLRASEILVVERDPTIAKEVSGRLGVEVAASPSKARSVVVAVKPHDAREALTALAASEPERVVSIMAGVRIAEIASLLGPRTSVLRAMPNLPAVLGEAASALAGPRGADEELLSWGAGVLAAFGRVVRVDEELLDLVTGLSGSGPAYVFLLAEALVAAGVEGGLGRAEASILARQTILGAARMMEDERDDPASLRARVTSPGGTTEAGLSALEELGFTDAVREAVERAAKRSAELGATGL